MEGPIWVGRSRSYQPLLEGEGRGGFDEVCGLRQRKHAPASGESTQGKSAPGRAVHRHSIGA